MSILFTQVRLTNFGVKCIQKSSKLNLNGKRKKYINTHARVESRCRVRKVSVMVEDAVLMIDILLIKIDGQPKTKNKVLVNCTDLT